MSNLVTNPTFEVNTVGWAGGGATISRSTEQAHSGVASLKVIFAGGNPFEYVLQDFAYPAPAIPLTSYAATLWIYDAAGGATIRIRIDEYSGAVYVTSPATPYTLSAGWQQLAKTWTTSASTDALYLGIDTGPVADAVTVYTDDFFLLQSNTAGIFYIGA